MNSSMMSINKGFEVENHTTDLQIWQEIERMSISSLPRVKGFVSLSGVFDLIRLESNPLGSYHLSSQNIFPSKEDNFLGNEGKATEQGNQRENKIMNSNVNSLYDASPVHILTEQIKDLTSSSINNGNDLHLHSPLPLRSPSRLMEVPC